MANQVVIQLVFCYIIIKQFDRICDCFCKKKPLEDAAEVGGQLGGRGVAQGGGALAVGPDGGPGVGRRPQEDPGFSALFR